MPRTIAVIDGNSLMHRAYHAVPPTMNAVDGTPTNAAFGFMSMLLKFYEDARPDAIVCAFDAGKPTHRIEAMKAYKAQRPPMDDELRVQFPVIEGLLDAMGIPVVKVKGWEGDDILGTIAARDEALGWNTLLVTGDKDAYQLVSDHTRVVTTRKGITDVVIYGPDEVLERYGVTAAQFPDFLGLQGDTADNIPGVPGIGPKTATKLLQAYGSMDGIYENLDKLKGKQLQNLADNRDQAYLSRDLAVIVQDLDFELDLESAAFPSFEASAVAEAFGAVQFSSHLARVLALIGGEGDLPSAASIELPDIDPATGDAALALLEAWLAPRADAVPSMLADEGAPVLGVEVVEPAQASLFESACIAFVSDGHDVVRFENEDAIAAVVRIVRDGCFCTLDAKATMQRAYPPDSSREAFVAPAELLSARAFDIGLSAYLLQSNASSYDYATLCEEYLAASLPAFDDACDEACAHAFVAPRLARALDGAMARDAEEASSDGMSGRSVGTRSCYYDIDLPLVPVLAVMERVGARIDVDALAEMGRSVAEEIDGIRTRVFELAGEEFNLDSPKQLSVVLFEKLGLPHGKKTQRGYSTDAKTLSKLEDAHPIAREILRYRELAKMESTYIEALPRMRAGDGLVHTHFNQTVTTTGRLSSSDPNLQNIPVRTEFGRRIRGCFVPLRTGDLFMSADYSQIELRLLAHLSRDEHLVHAFCSGADFHASTAARVFGVPLEEVTPSMRSRAKAVNFGIVYGQQAFGLAQNLGIGFKEAQEMIDRYFEAYPGVRAFLDGTVEEARACGYATTMFGRRRHIPELKAKNPAQRGFGERTAMNHPMQGTAADIVKMAMNEVQRRLVDGGFAAQVMIQVHDELDLSVPVSELDAVGALVRDAMTNVVTLEVPLIVDVQSAKTWAEAH